MQRCTRSARDVILEAASCETAPEPAGHLIVVMAHRLLGPSSLTSVLDHTHAGRAPAQGGQLRELTQREAVAALGENGLQDFRSVLPVPVVKRWMRHLRTGPRVVTAPQAQPRFLRLVHRTRKVGRAVVAFSVCLVCRPSV